MIAVAGRAIARGMGLVEDAAPAPILGLAIAETANTYYRLSVPVGTVGAVTHAYRPTPAQIAAAEVVVLNSFSMIDGAPAEKLDELFAKFRADGMRVLLDFDDEVREVPRRHARPGRNLPAALRACRMADALVCTGDALAARLRRLNPDVRIVPNYVRPDWTPPQPPPDAGGPVVITLAGSASHLSDWQVVAAPLRRIRADYGDRVRVRVAGYAFPYLAGLVDEALPWGPLDRYPAMLAGTAIGLCPLADTPFNACKSPIKAYEFGLAGAAVIGSPTQYGPVLADGRGLVCRTNSQWETAIRHYLDRPEARRRDADALQRHIVTALDARAHAAAIRAAYLN